MLEMTTKKTRPIRLRIELGLKQEDLAKAAKLNQSTISRIEAGLPITEATALKLFFAINRLRKEQNESELEFEDIAWNLYDVQSSEPSHEGDDE